MNNSYFKVLGESGDSVTANIFLRKSWSQVLSTGNFIVDFKLTLYTTYRTSRPEMSCKKGVLINFAKCTGKHLC